MSQIVEASKRQNINQSKQSVKASNLLTVKLTDSLQKTEIILDVFQLNTYGQILRINSN